MSTETQRFLAHLADALYGYNPTEDEMTTHTPTVWSRRNAGNIYGPSARHEILINGQVVATMKHLDSEAYKQAETIERACNAHEDLVAALTELHAWSRPFVERNPAISAETLWRRFPKAIEQARAALAKAKGEQ